MNERAAVGGECASSFGVTSGGWLCLKTSIERQTGNDNKPAYGVVHTAKESFSHRSNDHFLTAMDAIVGDSGERDVATLQRFAPAVQGEQLRKINRNCPHGNQNTATR